MLADLLAQVMHVAVENAGFSQGCTDTAAVSGQTPELAAFACAKPAAAEVGGGGGGGGPRALGITSVGVSVKLSLRAESSGLAGKFGAISSFCTPAGTPSINAKKFRTTRQLEREATRLQSIPSQKAIYINTF